MLRNMQKCLDLNKFSYSTYCKLLSTFRLESLVLPHTLPPPGSNIAKAAALFAFLD